MELEMVWLKVRELVGLSYETQSAVSILQCGMF